MNARRFDCVAGSGRSRDARPVLIIGGGLAGLAAALSLAPLPVVMLDAGRAGLNSSTHYAQGGIAVAVGGDDSPELHLADTLAAADGLADPEVAGMVAAEGPAALAALIAWGVGFDRDAAGAISLGLEAAHSRRRIAHAGGDATGAVTLAGLRRAAAADPRITLREDATAVDLLRDDNGVVVGALAATADGPTPIFARAVILATGGVGGLFGCTTNPLSSVGRGVALAARVGAVLRDLEFVQFHPTALDVGRDPAGLASEALRGEGAILVNDRGERFMAAIPGAELAPRDVVAIEVFRQRAAGRRVFLDATQALGARFAARFPTIAGLCLEAGVDPAVQPIPIRPAAHYHMGGVKVDLDGRTGVAGLYACGEVSCTGLHGANRLASNSLLEAAVYGRRVAAAILAETPAQPVGRAGAQAGFDPRPTDIRDLRQVMETQVGVLRDAAGLADAAAHLAAIAHDPRQAQARRDAALVGGLIAAAALRRRESRGGHRRNDCADKVAAQTPRDLTLADLAPATALAAE